MKIQEMMNDKSFKKSPKKLGSKGGKKNVKEVTKKRNESSDNGDSSSDDDEIEMMDDHEYRKFINSIFPSKHASKKVERGEKLKKAFKNLKNHKNEIEDGEISDNDGDEEDEYEDDYEDEEEEEETDVKNRKSKKTTNKNDKKNQKKNSKSTNKKNEKADKIVKSKSKRRLVESESDSDGSEEDEDFEDKASKFNIIFTIGGGEDDDEEWEYEEDSEEDDEWETEDEDEEVSSSEDEEEEEYDEDEEEEEEEEEEEAESEEEIVEAKTRRSKRIQNSTSKKNMNEDDNDVSNNSPKKSSSNQDFLKQLKELYKQNKDSSDAKECVKACEETIKKYEKKQKRKEKKHQEKNVRIFRKLVRDKNTNNDFEFFGKLEINEQKKIIKELREINTLIRVEKPYRLSLLESDMPPIFKGAAMKKINSLRYMEPGSGDYYKLKNWVDTFMRIPFGNYNKLPINIDDGVNVCHDFMENAKNCLDRAVYGLDDAKMQIMQMVGQLITNPSAIGTAIAIQGPMGTGKTTLVKEGISKILNRPFSFIALGGATDSSFLEGHSYTYEGSTWGKIVQILVDSKCMNPVIYFDELDKISDTPKGEEIAGILTHLTDTSQNSQFHDKYFAEVDFDLSKCLFIFSYNDESKINPILRDRMYRIHTKGYDKKQKTIIANNYLLPHIREQVKFTQDDIIIPEETLHYVMETHCNKEDGVRNMKRCLEIIHTKLNLYRLMKPDTNLFQENMTLKVEFPFTVTVDVVNKLIKKEEPNMSHLAMYL
tara:strand:- start:62990 stop:65284 length:2295 start_codon:yes stop_codon:yes gene_type:complete